MKPFDLEKALAGAKVVTRCGEPVEQLVLFNCESPYPLSGVFLNILHSWSKVGRSLGEYQESPFDLFMKSDKNSYWVNCYDDGSIFQHPTKESADKGSNNGKDEGFVTCLKVEWEE